MVTLGIVPRAGSQPQVAFTLQEKKRGEFPTGEDVDKHLRGAQDESEASA